MSTEFLESLNKFERRRISFSQITKIVKILNQKFEESGVISKPKSLAILGPSGNGKTTLVEGFLEKNKPYYEDTISGSQRVVPAFYFSIPSGATIKMIVDSMLTELGIVTSRNANTQRLTEQLKIAIANSKVKLIFTDETQHLLKEQGAVKTDEVRNWIKMFLDTIAIPVVFVGMPSCKNFILSDEQIARRVPLFLPLEHLTMPTTEKSDVTKIIKILKTYIQEDCDIELCPEGKTLDLAQRFHLAAGGRIAGIRALIYDAALYCHQNKVDTIELTHLAKMYSISPPLFQKTTTANPFDISEKSLKNFVQQQAA